MKSTLIAAALMMFIISTKVTAERPFPTWWNEQGVALTNEVNIHNPINLGQLNTVLIHAAMAFEARLPTADHQSIQNQISALSEQDSAQEVTLNQLRTAVQPCYDSLADYGLAQSPKIEENLNGESIVSMGQLQEFFNFDLPPTTNFYYVAPNGSNAALGTIDQPFRTIQYAVDQLTSGDTLFIRGGTYREAVSVNTAGTENAPITIRGFNEEFPTIKGSEVISNLVHYKDNIWMVTNWPSNPQQVFVDEEPFQMIGYPDEMYMEEPSWYNVIGLGIDSLFAKSYFWDSTTSNLLIHLPDAEPADTHYIELSTENVLIQAQKRSFIHIANLKTRHTSSTPSGSAIHLGEYSRIKNCDIQWSCFKGIHLKSNSSVLSCNVSNNGNSGIGGSHATNILVRGCTITNNNYRSFSAGWHAGGFKFIPHVAGTIEYNIISGNNGNGIWFDTCASGEPITIRNNTIQQNDIGVMVEISNNALIFNNLFISNSLGICIAETDHAKVFNNTIAYTFGHAGIFSRLSEYRIGISHTFSSNSYFNNILYNNTCTFDITLPEPNPYVRDNSSDYNCIYRSGNPAIFGAVTGLEEWREASGQDMHSIETDPLFLSPQYGVFTLASDSPCINAGTNIWSGYDPHDFNRNPRVQGSSPDMGCYEFQASEAEMRPEINISTSGTVPYDSTTLTGQINANVIGNVLVHTSSSTTTDQTVAIPTNLVWTMDISSLPRGIEYTIVASATNSEGIVATATVSLIKGLEGTGPPSISITNKTPIVQTSGSVVLGGTNNIHLTSSLEWFQYYNHEELNHGTIIPDAAGSWHLPLHNLQAGSNRILVRGFNDWGKAASNSVDVIYGNTSEHYVDIDSPNPTYPYTSWATASHTIQEAIDAASDGDSVFVHDGIYETGHTDHETGRTRVLVFKGIRVQSVHGPNSTVIKGSKEFPWPPYVRCLTVDHTNAVFSGFTLYSGHSSGETKGGGALVYNMDTMSNCIISDCTSSGFGGGICIWGGSDRGYGTLTSTILYNNNCERSGGGIHVQWGNNFTLENCVFSNNTAAVSGGGVSLDNSQYVYNCLITGNTAYRYGGGLSIGNNSKVYNCTIENNRAGNGGGVQVSAPEGSAMIYNSIITTNHPNNFTLIDINPSNSYVAEHCLIPSLPINLTSSQGCITNYPIQSERYEAPGLNMGKRFDWMTNSVALNGQKRILLGQPDIGCYEHDLVPEDLTPLLGKDSNSKWTIFINSNVNTLSIPIWTSHSSDLSWNIPGADNTWLDVTKSTITNQPNIVWLDLTLKEKPDQDKNLKLYITNGSTTRPISILYSASSQSGSTIEYDLISYAEGTRYRAALNHIPSVHNTQEPKRDIGFFDSSQKLVIEDLTQGEVYLLTVETYREAYQAWVPDQKIYIHNY